MSSLCRRSAGVSQSSVLRRSPNGIAYHYRMVGMEEFTADVPWGILKIESVDGGGDIPDADSGGHPVSANDGCVTVTVLHGDFGPVRVRVGGINDDMDAIIAFSGTMECPNRILEISDVVGGNYYFRLPVESDRVKLVVELDKLEDAEIVTIRVKAA